MGESTSGQAAGAESVWVGAGLLAPDDPDSGAVADRRALLTFLAEQGCTLEEMVRAHAEGRLFALAGDRLIGTGPPRHGTAAAAALLDLDPARLRRLWRAFGLPDPDDAPLSDTDVEVLRVALLLQQLVGEHAALGLARVIGVSLARVAEAGSSALRAGFSQIALGVTGSEVETARAFASVAALVPDYGRLIDVVHRHHIHAARRHFEAVEGDRIGLAIRCGVGFVDLSGFTGLSHDLDLGALSEVLTTFEDVATDEVLEHGGRVVKFLGDAVMFVSADPVALVAVGDALVHHPVAREAGVQVRGGLAFGDVLAQDGDYFGIPVNLASRLADSARPGELLCSQELVGLVAMRPTGSWARAPRVADAPPLPPGAVRLGPRAAWPQPPRLLRGFPAPVTCYRLDPLEHAAHLPGGCVVEGAVTGQE